MFVWFLCLGAYGFITKILPDLIAGGLVLLSNKRMLLFGFEGLEGLGALFFLGGTIAWAKMGWDWLKANRAIRSGSAEAFNERVNLLMRMKYTREAAVAAAVRVRDGRKALAPVSKQDNRRVTPFSDCQ